MLEYALSYLERGWSIIPCEGKVPRVSWVQFQNRLPSEEEVRKWWETWPESNIAIITGKISGIVVADVDINRGGDATTLPPTGMITRTGGGGTHHIYKYPGMHVQNKVGSDGIDIRGDGGYIIAPPSKHSSGGVYQWLQQEYIGDFPLDFFFPPEQKKAEKKEKWLSDLLKNGADRGGRNDAITRMAGYYASKEMPVDIAVAIISGWMEQQEDPLPTDEIDITVRSVYRTNNRGKKDKGQKESSFNLMTFGEYMRKYGDMEVKWLIENWLPDQTLAFLVSPPGSYKTWLLFDLAISVATGTPFLDSIPPTRKGPVLIIQQEDFHGAIAERLSTIYLSRFPFEISTDEEGSIQYVHRDDPPIYIYPDRNFRFDDDAMMHQLEEKLQQLRPALVLIDPFYSITSTEEYMQTAAQHLLRTKGFRDKYGTSFIFVAHTRKGASDEFERQDLWGSQFLNAALETGWQIRKAKDSPSIVVKRHFKAAQDAPLTKVTFEINTRHPIKYKTVLEKISLEEYQSSKKEVLPKEELVEVIREKSGMSMEELVEKYGDSGHKQLKKMMRQQKIDVIDNKVFFREKPMF
jgi:hypothetical protein